LFYGFYQVLGASNHSSLIQINQFHRCDHTPIPPFSWIGFPLLLIYCYQQEVYQKKFFSDNSYLPE